MSVVTYPRLAVFMLVLSALGCRTQSLGDQSLRGRLPSGWTEAPRQEALVRVQKDNVPVPFELWVHLAPQGTTHDGEGWTRAGEAVRPGPQLPYPEGHPNHGEVFQRQVILYTGRVGDRVLQATADARLDQEEVQRFLNSLEPG